MKLSIGLAPGDMNLQQLKCKSSVVIYLINLNLSNSVFFSINEEQKILNPYILMKTLEIAWISLDNDTDFW